MTPHHPRALPFILLAAALTFAACGDPEAPAGSGDSGYPPPADPCAEISCGEVGRCVVQDSAAACECPTGHRAEGLSCVADENLPVDLCDPNPCSEPNRSICRVEVASAVCDCDPGFVLQEGACVPERVGCEGEHEEGDAFEPDECPALARDIGTVGDQQEAHTLFPAGDHDWFAIAAKQGRIYRVEVESDVTVSLELYATQSPGEEGPPRLPSRIGSGKLALAVKAADAQLYVRVKASSAEVTGEYTISVRDEGLDDHGDDESAATQVFPTGVEQSGRWQFAGDKDWLRFEAQAGHIYRVSCFTTGLGNSCALKLYGAAGTELASNANPAALLTWSAPGDGTFFVELAHLHDQEAGYTWKLEDFGPDDHGNDSTSATQIDSSDYGVEQTGTWNISGDTDWVKFAAEAGHVYRFTCLSAVSPCVVRLVDALGMEVATDTGAPSSLTWKVPADSTYFLELARPATNPGTGAYTWKLEDLGVDDHGDSAGEATTVLPGGFDQNGSWEFSGDRDWLHFDADAGHIYRIACATSGLGNQCAMRLLDATGNVLHTETSAAVLVTWIAPTTAPFFIELGLSNSETAGYTWKLEDLGTDDHGNSFAVATPVTSAQLGVLNAGRWEISGDRDVLSFDATAGHIYRFTCTGVGSSPCEARVFDAGGLELASRSGTNAIVGWRAAVAATFYIQLARPSSNPGTGDYTWMLEDLGADDHGGDMFSATYVTADGVEKNANWEVAGDKDWMRFDALANQILRFNCTPTATLQKCAFKLYDANGVVLASPTTSNFISHNWRVPADGTYYMEFANAASTVTGTYTWKLTHVSTDEHGDDLASATVVTATGVVNTAKWNIAGDLDFLRFDAPDGNRYRITCVTRTSGAACKLTLRDANGTAINTATTTTTPGNSVGITWQATAGTSYWVELTRSTAGTGDYEWKLEDLGP